jgi:hypothetical protein
MGVLYSTFYPIIIDHIQQDFYVQVTTMDFNEFFVNLKVGVVLQTFSVHFTTHEVS